MTTYPNDIPTRSALVLRACCGIALVLLVFVAAIAFVVEFAMQAEEGRKTREAIERSKSTERKAEKVFKGIERQREAR